TLVGSAVSVRSHYRDNDHIGKLFFIKNVKTELKRFIFTQRVIYTYLYPLKHKLPTELFFFAAL
ncbi:hypothetical protein, partial [Vibrio cortegadensis]|uniref:hypothetical protein n=1 Tax=Vibrio cortegadensis TaxID=1328770 RepID=UPI00352C13F1